MIHISTDCVFNGKKGNYTEVDPSDAEDLYGRTKFLGEVSYPHTITLRTSIIGRELKTRLGLIEWFLAQKGEIQGYKKAIYSGFTTDELSRIVMDYIIPRPDLSGVYNVSSDPISKFDLLGLAKESFRHNVNISPNEEFIIDRSLNSTRFRQATGYNPPSWPEMIEMMTQNSSLYENIGDWHDTRG
jgi:dTDP-4-dehydrorhamnose reductase